MADVTSLPAVDPDEIARVLAELVAIPSVNPAFSGGTGEAGVAEYVQSYLEANGIPWIEQAVEPCRSNIIGMLPGRSAGPALLFEAHTDTVQTTGMTIDPFQSVVADGRLYGRGACDTKGSLAAMLVACATLRRSGASLPVGVHIAAVVDEEYRYKGVSRLASAIEAGELAYSAAIVGEPTGLNRVVAHKGCVRFRIEAHGVSGHSSEPLSGINAIERMCRVIAFLQAVIAPSYLLNPHPLVGPATHCISEIRGGEAPNTIPGSCTVTVDRRTVPGEEPHEVWRELKRRLLQFADSLEGGPDPALTVHEPFIVDYAMEVPEASPILRHLAAAAAAAFDIPTSESVAAYGTDASKLARVGVPSVVFGPGNIAQAHTDDEWVDLAEVTAAAEALVHTAIYYGED